MTETKYTGLDDFRQKLESEGWRVSMNSMQSQFNTCNWYAWSVDRKGISPDCACNDKPPILVIYPSDGWMGEIRLDSLEVEITGETKTGEWLKLRAYGIKPHDLDAKWTIVRARLIAAWSAAASLEIDS